MGLIEIQNLTKTYVVDDTSFVGVEDISLSIDRGDFLSIVGHSGSGKTTLIRYLLNNIDASIVPSVVFNTNVTAEEFFIYVMRSFELEYNLNNKAKNLGVLYEFVLEQYSNGKQVLLIIDEAQNLSDATLEEIRMLSNFQIDGRPLVQIFLLGQEEFRSTLLSEGFEQLRQRVIATYHLNPLDEEETRTYVEHRLACANWRGNPHISADAFAAIYRSSEGVPRRINNLCDRLLLYAFLEDRETIDLTVVEAVSHEIGSEFWTGNPEPAEKVSEPAPAAAPAGEPLETMARVMFDKANVQQRLASLERAVDALGATLKPEIAELREEVTYLRILLEEVNHELRSLGGKGKKSA